MSLSRKSVAGLPGAGPSASVALLSGLTLELPPVRRSEAGCGCLTSTLQAARPIPTGGRWCCAWWRQQRQLRGSPILPTECQSPSRCARRLRIRSRCGIVGSSGGAALSDMWVDRKKFRPHTWGCQGSKFCSAHSYRSNQEECEGAGIRSIRRQTHMAMQVPLAALIHPLHTSRPKHP
eukprot:356009-Chlamydomonas_euryale.AAC.7